MDKQKEQPKKPKLTNMLLLLVAVLLISQFFFSNQGDKTPQDDIPQGPILLEPVKDNFAQGQVVTIRITNTTDSPLTIPSNCPENPLEVSRFTGTTFEPISATTESSCANIHDTVIAPQDSEILSFQYWSNALFGELGRYKVTLGEVSSPEFEIVEPGFFRQIGRTFFYKPIYNALVFLIDVMPGHSLGFAIIALTLFLRLILLAPSQKAMNSQRRMQVLQPKLAHIREKYKGNQERIAMETMALWKEHKVNPFGSCLPLLMQFPILIALFYVIQNGLNPDQTFLVYPFLEHVDLTAVSTNFLGILELMDPNLYVLPLIVGALQFFQMKLATFKNKGQAADKSEKKDLGSEMEIANKSMVYILPVMIAVFTASLPAGVGLYWATSTLFAVGQQFVANKKN